MVDEDIQHLRILIANERPDRREVLTEAVIALGHAVIPSKSDLAAVGAVIAREHPDVALVGLGDSPEDALEWIEQIVREATCPVIAVVSVSDSGYIREAARRGVFAYVGDTTPEQLQSAIDVTFRRFSEYRNLQDAFGRRAVIEQAKGILMARQSVDAAKAFEILRDHSQHGGHKLIDVAQALIHSHLLLPFEKPPPPE